MIAKEQVLKAIQELPQNKLIQGKKSLRRKRKKEWKNG